MRLSWRALNDTLSSLTEQQVLDLLQSLLHLLDRLGDGAT